MGDNYPLGAKDDEKAPYNEPLDVPHKRYCSLTISFDHTIKANPNVTEEELKELFIKDIISRNFNIPKEYYIDDFEIME